jgi:hypothetical protein
MMGGMKGHAAVPFTSGYLRSWERNSPVPYSISPRHLQRSGLKVERKKWRCPKCRRRFRVLVGYDPQFCPECDEHTSSMATAPIERRKILVEQPDPLVEVLARLTGHRFSSRRLVQASIWLAVLLAVFMLGVFAVGPLNAAVRQVFAESAPPKQTIEEPPPPKNVGIVPVIRLPDFMVPPAPPGPIDVAPLQLSAKVQDRVQGPAPDNPANGDPEMAAVRAWLKSHRDDVNYHIVKWWPAKAVDNDLINYAGLLKTDRVARLRYQDNQSDGIPSIHDDIFVIRDNKARAVPQGENWWWDEVGGWTQLIIRGARRMLPDASDEKAPPLADAMKKPLAPLPTKLVEHHPNPPKHSPPRPKAQKNQLARGRLMNGPFAKRRANPWWAKFNDKADVDLARDWIKDNFPEGKEIRWWKPRDLVAYGWSRTPSRAAVLPADDRQHRLLFLRAGGRMPDRLARERVCRIKVSVEEPNKPPKIQDRLFVIASRTVEPIDDPQHKRREWKYFPDSAGEKPDAAN